MFSRASGSWWITTTSFKGYWGEKKKNPKQKVNSSVSPGLSQSHKAVTHSQGMTGDVRSSNLDWDGFSVSDNSSQLNHRLQTRNGTLNFFVDEILPRLERKHNCFIFITFLWADWKPFFFFPHPLLWHFLQQTQLCPGWGNLKNEQTGFSSLCGEDEEEITCWKQIPVLFLHLLLAPLTRCRGLSHATYSSNSQ